MHWEQIGYILERKEQFYVTYEDISMRIFAPTIRYHDGIDPFLFFDEDGKVFYWDWRRIWQ